MALEEPLNFDTQIGMDFCPIKKCLIKEVSESRGCAVLNIKQKKF